MTPIESLNHVIATEFLGGTPVTAWYIGLFEGNYTPTPDVKASTLPGLATECTAYASTTRVPFVPGAVANGAIDNSANLAQFVMTADKTIYGTFIVSAPAKGATTGVLADVVRFASPKFQPAGSTLSVLAGPTAAPAS